jgi:hypothetical protein
MMIHIYLVVLISEDDVISGIKQLKSTKIYGSDTIQNDHLIFRGPKLVICLTIYQLCSLHSCRRVRRCRQIVDRSISFVHFINVDVSDGLDKSWTEA